MEETHDITEDRHEPARTLDPGALVRSNYAFQRYDRKIDRTVSFRPVRMDRDLGRLHTWLGYDHVAEFWSLDMPLPAFRDHLAGKLAEDNLTPYIGYIDHVPMSYWEIYWPGEYELDDYYDAKPGDRAGHLLVGPSEYIQSGYARALWRAMGTMVFSHPGTERIVGEPEANNDVVIHLLEECGFEARKEFHFEEADKDALLMICDRETFEETMLGGSPSTLAHSSADG